MSLQSFPAPHPQAPQSASPHRLAHLCPAGSAGRSSPPPRPQQRRPDRGGLAAAASEPSAAAAAPPPPASASPRITIMILMDEWMCGQYDLGGRGSVQPTTKRGAAATWSRVKGVVVQPAVHGYDGGSGAQEGQSHFPLPASDCNFHASPKGRSATGASKRRRGKDDISRPASSTALKQASPTPAARRQPASLSPP